MMTFDMDTMPVAAERTIETIEGEIQVLKSQTAQNIVEIGKRLIEAKGMLQHGQWQPWLEHNAQFSYRTAARFMQVAERFANVSALAGLEASKVYALLDVAPDQLEGFVEQNDVENLSARQLQDAVKAQKAAEARVAQLAMDLEDAKTKAKAEKDEAVKAAEKEGEGKLRAAVTEKSKAMRDLREAERKLKELQDTDEKGGEASAELMEAQEKVRQLEEDLKKAQEGGKIPDDVEAELARLRQIEKAAPSAEVIRVREGYERLVQEFDRVLALLGEAAAANPEAGRKYAAAIRKALDLMAGKLDGMAEVA